MRLLDEPKQMVVELALLKNELVLVVGLGQRASQQQAPIVLRERLGFYNEPVDGFVGMVSTTIISWTPAHRDAHASAP